jgi:hypothetical protein
MYDIGESLLLFRFRYALRARGNKKNRRDTDMLGFAGGSAGMAD